MPYVHHQDFPVRHYECDMYGEVNHANYLRYMQEAAFGASAAVGYSPARYAELKLQWLAYETDIEYLAPLLYEDTVSVKTWVHDFRRVRSLRHYELTRNGQIVARASTDWVLIDLERMFPATIPQPVIDAYSGGDPVEPAPKRTPLPPAKIPETGLHTIERRVAWPEIDEAAHVNNAFYLSYAEDCEMQAMAAFGWPMPRIREELGAMPVVRRHQIEYKQAAVLDDMLTISTWLAAIDETTLLRHVVVRRAEDDKLINRVRVLREWVDLATGQPQPIPAVYRTALQANLVGK